MRRPHRKSRYGCKECKQRHAKCDEARPVCGSCATAKRQCSYLTLGPSLPPPPFPSPSPGPSLSTGQSPSSASYGPSPAAHSTPSDSITSHSPTAAPQTGTLPFPHPPGDTPEYTLLHLELLHHLQHDFIQATVPKQQQPAASKMLEMSLHQAFFSHAPFLMDQLLALAAAHKSTSTLCPPQHQQARHYRTEATRLQTRALARYPAAMDGPPLPVFLFSTFLGQQVLFETFAPFHDPTAAAAGADLAAFLEQLVHCLGLHRGIAAVAGREWPALMAELRERLGEEAEYFNPEAGGGAAGGGGGDVEGGECDGLMARFNTEEGGGEGGDKGVNGVCRAAVGLLQRAFDMQRMGEGGQFVGAQEWLVRVSGEYISLLARRQPEALVVLGWYGVVLHRARGHWIVGGVGEALVRGVSDHLGGYWGYWMEWPRRAVLEERG